jgi:hypothetical protein
MRTHIPVARTILSVAMLLLVPHCRAAIVDPLGDGPTVVDSSNTKPANPFTISDSASTKENRTSQLTVRTTQFLVSDVPPSANDAVQPLPLPAQQPPQPAGVSPTGSPAAALPDPCSFAPHKPLSQLGINIAAPEGKLPSDLAGSCWEQINAQSDPCCDRRCWPILLYEWDATSLCYNPLYFEEINLERYGYGCGCCCCCGLGNCVQPFVSGAHFFGTLPILPYCMAHECPGDCVYTLGHYRPGSCPPWQCYRPPIDPVAGAAEAGFWIGMCAAFP